MTILFAGGEEGDFLKSSTACSADTATTAARRSGARCTLKITTTASATEGWGATFPATFTSCWLTARSYYTVAASSGNTPGRGLAFTDGGVTRLAVCVAGSASLGSAGPAGMPISLCKFNAAGTKTTLATSSSNFPGAGAQARFDVQLSNYGTSATVTVYLEGVQVLTYTGDVTTDGATSLNGARLHGWSMTTGTADSYYWSEVIAATTDTRGMALATLAPNANGATFAWTGSYAALNETTLDDTTLATTSSTGQTLQVAVNSSTVPATAAIQALVVAARAQQGAGGPTQLAYTIAVPGSSQSGVATTMPGSFGRIQWVSDTNWVGAPWAPADVTAAGFNIGVISQ